MEIAKGLGRLFYLINPEDTFVKEVEDLPQPDYFAQAFPYFATGMVIEYLIQWYKGKGRARINDGITSISLGMMMIIGKLAFRGVESYVYIKVYENYRIYELPWDSYWTFFFAALAADFGYYWMHRFSHEWYFIWAQHQVHHSSEDYNMTTAMRQSVFQYWIGSIFYVPFALFVPPAIFLIHLQLAMLFQFWLHTELLDSVGPVLKYILNTPRYHKIHHGRNKYCLDKNYAAVLIIWDRMFGTFADEKPGEKVVFGLVDNVESMNPFWLQLFYFPKIWRGLREMESWSGKLKAFFKGPSPTEVSEVPKGREKYDPKVPEWQTAYAVMHFLILVGGLDYLSKDAAVLSQTTVVIIATFMIYSLTSIGLIIENRPIGRLSEFFRCAMTAAVLVVIYNKNMTLIPQLAITLFAMSAITWAVNFVHDRSILTSQSKAFAQPRRFSTYSG